MDDVVTVRRLWAGHDEVGESPVWDDRSRTLLWVDIIGKRIHRLDPLSGSHDEWPAPELVTSIGLCESGHAIVGLRKTVALWSFGGDFAHLATIEADQADNRLNEARVGPDGCFWVGTMQNNITEGGDHQPITASSGRLYRVHPSGAVEVLSSERFGICNTMAWPRGGAFICADTLANSLYRYELDDGELRNRQAFGPPVERGLPDGSAIDAEGYLWNCRVGGGCVVRIAPNGAVDRVIDLPCSSPTSCAFGGEDMRTLFVTSARFGVDVHRRNDLDEGALYSLQPGPRGLVENRFLS